MQTDHYFPFSLELGKVLQLEGNKPLQMALIHVLINSAIYFNSNAPFGSVYDEFPFEETFRGAAEVVAEAIKGRLDTENLYSILLWEFYNSWNNPYKIEIGYEDITTEIVDKLSHHPWVKEINYHPD